MKNSLGDLHNHLFAELERLSDEDLQGADLDAEIKRAHAVTGIASQLIANGNLVLKAMKFDDDKLSTEAHIPKMLQGDA